MSERPNTMAAKVARSILLAVGLTVLAAFIWLAGLFAVGMIGTWCLIMWSVCAAQTGKWWPFDWQPFP